MDEANKAQETRDKYTVRLERTCPTCFQEVVKEYARETLRMIAGSLPITDCPYCHTRF